MRPAATDQTTLAFVRTVDGEPQYAFYDEGTASRNWTYRRGSIAFDEIDAVHVGSTTLIDEKTAAETLAMVEEARGSATISFDPNCRPNLVKHKARYVERMDAFAATASIVRMSDVDFEFLYGGSDYAGRAKSLLAAGASLVVVTRGIRGAQAWHRRGGRDRSRRRRRSMSWTPSAPATVFRRRCCSPCAPSDGSRPVSLAQANSDELRRALSFAASCAAFTCGRAGADPPYRSEIPANSHRRSLWSKEPYAVR